MEDKIESVIHGGGPMSARSIAKILNIDNKKTVNTVLYNSPKFSYHVGPGAAKPIWTIVHDHVQEEPTAGRDPYDHPTEVERKAVEGDCRTAKQITFALAFGESPYLPHEINRSRVVYGSTIKFDRVNNTVFNVDQESPRSHTVSLVHPTSESHRFDILSTIRRLEAKSPGDLLPLTIIYSKPYGNPCIIVGSRDINPSSLKDAALFGVVQFLRNSLSKHDMLIVGNAQGVDAWARQTATDMGLPIMVYNKEDYADAFVRDDYMLIENICPIYAVWDGESPGTARTIAREKHRTHYLKIDKDMTFKIHGKQ